MPKLFYFLLPLSIVAGFLRSTCDRTQRHCTGGNSIQFGDQQTFDESESVLLRFLRKVESANENFPDSGFVGLIIGIGSLVYGTAQPELALRASSLWLILTFSIDIEPKSLSGFNDPEMVTAMHSFCYHSKRRSIA
jgi:hypothetical protein